MKTERRHELQTNVLADSLGHAVDTVRPYSQIVIGAVLAAVVVIGVVKYLSVRSQESVTDAWNLYLQASTAGGATGDEELARLIEQYPDTAAAQWSHLQLADQGLSEGIGQLFQNRSEANEKLRKADQHYQAVLQKASDPLLRERATLGLARVFESQGNLEKAQQEYERLVKEWPNGAYAIAANERVKDLKQKSTKEFYDWFAVNEPKSSGLDGLGTPGSRPSFNLDSEDSNFPPLNLNPATTPPDATPPSDAEKTSQGSSPDSATEPVSTASRVSPEKEEAKP